jgi:Tfp pilus assembly protein PilX
MMQKIAIHCCPYDRNPARPTAPSMASQRGFSLFSAIFLLVMLSALGAAIVKVTSSSQIASALDIQGERGYQAARAGIEWGLYQQRIKNSCPQDATSFALPAGTTLAGFTVTVKCSAKLMKFAGTLMNGDDLVNNVADTGMLADGVPVSGTGIPAGTTINVTSPNTVTLSQSATASGVQDITYQSDLDTYTLKSTACNQPNASGACPHDSTSNHPDYVQRVLEVRFSPAK